MASFIGNEQVYNCFVVLCLDTWKAEREQTKEKKRNPRIVGHTCSNTERRNIIAQLSMALSTFSLFLSASLPVFLIIFIFSICLSLSVSANSSPSSLLLSIYLCISLSAFFRFMFSVSISLCFLPDRSTRSTYRCPAPRSAHCA